MDTNELELNEEQQLDIDNITEALAEFVSNVLDRLVDKIREGSKGWNDPKAVTPMAIKEHLLKDANLTLKGHPKEIDIAARAMFLWHRRNHNINLKSEAEKEKGNEQ